MELEAGKVIAKQDGVVYLMEAKSATAAAEEDGGIIIVPADAEIYATSTTEGIGKCLVDLGYTITPAASAEETATVVTPESKQTAIANALFESGSGTSSDPYIITNEQQFGSINALYNTSNSNKYYFKLNNDIDLSNVAKDDDGVYIYVNYADIDLGGKNLKNLSGELINSDNYIKIHNGNIEFTGNSPDLVWCSRASDNYAEFTNLNLTGSVIVNDGPFYGVLSSYFGNTRNTTQYTTGKVENVNSWVTIKSSGTYVGGLFGYCKNSKITIENSNVYSSITATLPSGGFIMGSQYQSVGTATNTELGKCLSITNSKFYGMINCSTTSYYCCCSSCYNYEDDVKGDSALLVNTIDITDCIKLPNNFGEKIAINHENNIYTKYVLTLSFNVDSTTYGAGGYPRTLSFEIDASSAKDGDVLDTGCLKYHVSDGTYDSNNCTWINEELGIFVKNSDLNTLCYQQENYKVSSSCAVSVNVYAYSGDVLKATGSVNYSGK